MANLFCLNEYVKKTQDSEENPSDGAAFELNWQIYGGFPLICLALLSCFITVMLSATRTLALAKPLYSISRKFVFLAYGICILILFILLGTKCIFFSSSLLLKTIGIIDIFTVTISAVVVGIFTVISVRALRNSNKIIAAQKIKYENSRKAAIMIITLSTVFVISNGMWSVIWGVAWVVAITGSKDGSSGEAESTGKANLAFAQLINIVMIALNSSCNPIVYILRNSALNEYTKTHFRRLGRFLLTIFKP